MKILLVLPFGLVMVNCLWQFDSSVGPLFAWALVRSRVCVGFAFELVGIRVRWGAHRAAPVTGPARVDTQLHAARANTRNDSASRGTT